MFADAIVPCDGARIKLELCNSCDIAKRIERNNLDKNLDINCTDGENWHYPIDWKLWPGDGLPFQDLDGPNPDGTNEGRRLRRRQVPGQETVPTLAGALLPQDRSCSSCY